MKKIVLLILAVWESIMAFLSPLWLGIVGICFGGNIHVLDAGFNEKLAVPLGVVFLVLWIVVAAVPGIAFYIGVRKNRKGMICAAVIMAALVLLCLAVCGWNPAGFLASL